MIRDFFLTCESLTPNDSLELQPFIDQLAFDANGLLPVITQDSQSREVLMLAWMNKVALYKTLLHQRMFYWSRSRKALWEKGKTSGHYQYVQSIRFDCDGDAILCQVKQVGAACHTERKSCFYFEADTVHKTISITTTAPNKGTE